MIKMHKTGFNLLKTINLSLSKQSGFSLIETVLALSILAVVSTSLITVFLNIGRYSSDPIIIQQALQIAKSYLTEISSKSFPNQNPCVSSGAAREDFTNICDYQHSGSLTPSNQFGNNITGLEQYSVQISINQNTSLGDLSGSSQVAEISVQVDHPQLPSPISLRTYKTNY